MYSPWYPTTLSTNTAITANVIMQVSGAQFIDQGGYCQPLGLIDPRYFCY